MRILILYICWDLKNAQETNRKLKYMQKEYGSGSQDTTLFVQGRLAGSGIKKIYPIEGGGRETDLGRCAGNEEKSDSCQTQTSGNG